MAKSPVKNSEGVVGISVYINNQVVPSKISFESVFIRKEINRIGQAEITFRAGSVAQQNIPESENSIFDPGQEIRIEAGYDGVESIIFQGIIVTHDVNIPPGESARLIIGCRDCAFPSTLIRQNRLFTKKKDSEALTAIWGDYSLKATIDSSSVKYPELIQYYCSDWDFTLSRADVNGWVVITEQKKISIQKPVVSGTPVLKLTYGVDLMEFSGTQQTDAQHNDVSAWGWDSTRQKLVKVSAAKPSINDQGTCDPAGWVSKTGIPDYTLQTGCVVEESALKAWANAKRLRSSLARITGSFRFQGNAKVNPGTIVELDGVGKRFNGKVYVGYVEHDIKNGNWYTTAGMGIDSGSITEQPDVVAPSASGLLPGIQGLHIGIVTKLEDDPSGEHRIEVEFPLLNGEKNKLWARMAHGWASKNSGFFFLPDKGDEVVLGFFNNDPCHAVILGCLYSSKRTPPFAYSNDNNIRAILTRSKMKLEFDEENKIITLITPGKNQIVVNDKNKSITLQDEHKNKVIMDKNGIKLDSAKDIQLKATGDIKIQSGKNTAIKATSNLNMEGVNVEAKASAALTAKGSAKAELSASGQTIVKGAMVMIN